MAEQLRKKSKKKSDVSISKDSSSLASDEFQPFPDSSKSPSNPKYSAKTSKLIKQYSSISKTEEPKVEATPKSAPSEVQSSIKLRNKIDPIKKIEQDFEDLNQLEKLIINIAKTVLKKKRYEATIDTQRPENMSPLVEELHERCVAKLTHTRGYSRELIFETIQTLHANKWIITDQRRTRQEILASKTLKQVLDFIHKHPGTHARNEEIQETLSITRNPFIKHVMVLEAFGLIRSKKIGRTLNYFVTELPAKFDEFVVLFANPMVPEIIFEFLKNPKVSLSEIARNLDVYHGAIQYHVKKLKSMEIMIKVNGNWEMNKALLTEYNEMFDVPPFTDSISN